MSLTVENNPAGNARSDEVWGRVRIKTVTVTFDSDYAEGGEAFDPGAYGVGTPRQVVVSARPHARAAYVVYDPDNEKLVAYGIGTTDKNTELCHCDLSDLVVDVTIIGD